MIFTEVRTSISETMCWTRTTGLQTLPASLAQRKGTTISGLSSVALFGRTRRSFSYLTKGPDCGCHRPLCLTCLRARSVLLRLHPWRRCSIPIRCRMGRSLQMDTPLSSQACTRMERRWMPGASVSTTNLETDSLYLAGTTRRHRRRSTAFSG